MTLHPCFQPASPQLPIPTPLHIYMVPPCICRSCWYRPWPLLGHQAEVSWAEPAVQGYRDVGQPAHDGGSYSSGTVEGTAAPTPAWNFPWCRKAWLARLRAPGQGLDPVAVVVNHAAISVGEARWSGPLGLPQWRTAPLHCLSASRQLLYIASR